MSLQIRLLLFASAWVGATFGVLALERIPGNYAHAYCGAWGCLPPLQALAAMHGFWLMMMIPPTAWLVARTSPARLWLAGVLVFWIGIFGLVVVASRGLTGWLETAGEFRRYAGYRLLYVVVTATDLPFGQLALAGSVSWLVGRHRIRAGGTRRSEEVIGLVSSSSLPAQGKLVRDECIPQQTVTESVSINSGADSDVGSGEG